MFIKVCPQRHDNDCAVCCLVMLTGVSYEAALVAIGLGAEAAKLAKNGLYWTEVKKAGKKLGFDIKTVRVGKYNLEESVGILSVKFKDRMEHAVILFHGTIIDPDGGKVWPSVADYKKTMEVKRFGSLLTL